MGEEGSKGHGVVEEMSYLTFHSSESMNSFLRRKIEPTIHGSIEFCAMEKYPANRVLFTAEHAVSNRVMLKGYGKGAYANVGDVNTDVLAKLAAFNLRSAYILPRFNRAQADASRPPEDLGKGLRLFSRIFGSKVHGTTFLSIHSDPSYLPHLEGYHKVIEDLDPKAVVSIHGMSIKRKFDLLFGFGEEYNTIGGKKEAFRFKNEFALYLDGVFSSLKMKGIDIAVSTWLLTGSRNYIMNRHVTDYNKVHARKRIGMQVEFNWRGRMHSESRIPTLQYQIVVQALGDFILKWTGQLR